MEVQSYSLLQGTVPIDVFIDRANPHASKMFLKSAIYITLNVCDRNCSVIISELLLLLHFLYFQRKSNIFNDSHFFHPFDRILHSRISVHLTAMLIKLDMFTNQNEDLVTRETIRYAFHSSAANLPTGQDIPG